MFARWRLRRQNELPDATLIQLRQLFWLWIAVITVFFSIPTSKLVGYVLPAIPALAALLTEGLINGTRFSLRWKFALVVVAAAVCVGSIIAITRADDITSKPLAKAYRDHAAPGEPLVFLQTYRFDIPFYAQLAQPIIIIDKWDEPITTDSWSKEMADAAVFKPTAGAKVLVNTPDMLKVLCAQSVTWVITPKSFIASSKQFQSLEPVASNSLYALVKISSSLPPLKCP
jgi:hypothetical protein